MFRNGTGGTRERYEGQQQKQKKLTAVLIAVAAARISRGAISDGTSHASGPHDQAKPETYTQMNAMIAPVSASPPPPPENSSLMSTPMTTWHVIICAPPCRNNKRRPRRSTEIMATVFLVFLVECA